MDKSEKTLKNGFKYNLEIIPKNIPVKLLEGMRLGNAFRIYNDILIKSPDESKIYGIGFLKKTSYGFTCQIKKLFTNLPEKFELYLAGVITGKHEDIIVSFDILYLTLHLL